MSDARAEVVYRELESVDLLPGPSRSATDLWLLCHRPDVQEVEVARAISHNTPVADAVMRSTGGLRRGDRSTESLAEAVSRLGTGGVASLAIAYSTMSEHRSGPCRDFDYDAHWSESLARAVAMETLAHRLGAMPAADAFAYGLLTTVGRLAFAVAKPSSYGDLVCMLSGGPRAELAEAEAELFGCDARELSAWMLRRWGLRRLLAAQRGTEEGLLLPMLELSQATAEILVDEVPVRDQFVATRAAAMRLGIAPEEYETLFPRIAKTWMRTGAQVSVSTRVIEGYAATYVAAGVATELAWVAPSD